MGRIQKYSKRRIAAVVMCSVLIVVNVAFVFYNSLQDAVDSTLISENVTGIFQGILTFIYSGLMISEKVIRKIAHFIEFASLGTWCSILVNLLSGISFKFSIISIIFGALVAVVDENLQRFSFGRSFSIFDILIDISGIIFSVIIINFAVILFRKKNDKKL